MRGTLKVPRFELVLIFLLLRVAEDALVIDIVYETVDVILVFLHLLYPVFAFLNAYY